MPLNDPTAPPLTIQDLLDLDRDPRPDAMFRAMTGLSDDRLKGLDKKLTEALPHLKESPQYTQLCVIRSYARRILENRLSQTTYSRLLAEAV